MASEVSWPVRSQPSLQCTTTEVFPDSTLSAMRSAPAKMSYKCRQTNNLVKQVRMAYFFFYLATLLVHNPSNASSLSP